MKLHRIEDTTGRNLYRHRTPEPVLCGRGPRRRAHATLRGLARLALLLPSLPAPGAICGAIGFLHIASVDVGATIAIDRDPQLGSILAAVVSCTYLDTSGLMLRRTSGLILEEGLLLPYAALLGAATVVTRSRTGQTFRTDRLASLHPEAGLALLEIDGTPDYAIPKPTTLMLPDDAEIRLIRGPEGPGPSTRSVALHGRFHLNGPDYLAISAGLEDGSGAFRDDGELIGVCFDLSEQGYSLAYLASAASISNLVQSRGPAVPLESILPALPPTYHERTSAPGLAFRAALLATAGRSHEARRFLELAIRKDADLAPAHFFMGRIYFGEQRFDQAAASFQLAGELAENYHLAWHMAGVSRNQAGDYAGAIEMYRNAVRVDPQSALTWCNLGSAEFNRHNFPEAETAFETAIEIDPSFGLSYFNLAILQKRLGRSRDAEATHQILAGRDPAWAERLRSALDGN